MCACELRAKSVHRVFVFFQHADVCFFFSFNYVFVCGHEAVLEQLGGPERFLERTREGTGLSPSWAVRTWVATAEDVLRNRTHKLYPIAADLLIQLQRCGQSVTQEKR